MPREGTSLLKCVSVASALLALVASWLILVPAKALRNARSAGVVGYAWRIWVSISGVMPPLPTVVCALALVADAARSAMARRCLIVIYIIFRFIFLYYF